MTQTAIPYIFMRGGTSRGPYFRREDLPQDRDLLADVLIAAIGAGHPINIDGIGGGNAVTTKVAMLSAAADDPDADIDYFFAQVAVEERLVDFKPTCGNILIGVGPAAIEMGLVQAAGEVTEVRIRSVNTGALVRARIETPQGRLHYEGTAAIDGVPGTAAPIEVSFMDVAGSSTGAMLPTGNAMDTFGGVEVSCVDVAMPMVIARAADFGLRGDESREELEANRGFFDRMEKIRLEAGEAMGLGDCSKSVTPKFGLLAPLPESDKKPGHILARYFMPWQTHPSMAVTGSQAMASCALAPGTIAAGMMQIPDAVPARIYLHHPMGVLEVLIDYAMAGNAPATAFIHKSAGLVRTARKLAAGEVFIPASIWDGK